MSKFDKNNDLNKLLKLNANLIYSNIVTVNRNWQPELHTHPHTEIFYVTKGSGKLILKDSEIDLNTNDFLIINSNLMHTEANAHNKDNFKELEYFVIAVKGISISELNSSINDEKFIDYFINKYIFKISFENSDNIFVKIMKNIHNEFVNKNSYYTEYSNSLLNMLLIEILRLNNKEIVIENDFKKNKQLEYIKNYIDSHFAMDLKLDVLSEVGYINKYYLIHQFKKLYDITPMDYVNHVRLNAAKDLLKNSDLSMQEISSTVGFNSQSYFNQLFKKKEGLTPSKYRKNTLSEKTK